MYTYHILNDFAFYLHILIRTLFSSILFPSVRKLSNVTNVERKYQNAEPVPRRHTVYFNDTFPYHLVSHYKVVIYVSELECSIITVQIKKR